MDEGGGAGQGRSRGSHSLQLAAPHRIHMLRVIINLLLFKSFIKLQFINIKPFIEEHHPYIKIEDLRRQPDRQTH